MKYLILLLLLIPSVQALGGSGSSENYAAYTQISAGGTNTTSESYMNNLLVGEIAGNMTSESYDNCLGFWCVSELPATVVDFVKGVKQYYPVILLVMLMFIGTIGRKQKSTDSA